MTTNTKSYRKQKNMMRGECSNHCNLKLKAEDRTQFGTQLKCSMYTVTLKFLSNKTNELKSNQTHNFMVYPV